MLVMQKITIDGYSLYRNDRTCHGGGVALYVKSSIPHSLCPILTHDFGIEVVWVTLKPNYCKPFRVCAFYRPPNADTDYYERMLSNFEAALADHEVIILGDFNMNYQLGETLAKNPAHHIGLLLNCSQLIDIPTRVTASTSSIIDLIYTSMPDNQSSSGVVECSLSDHYMTYTVVQLKDTKRSESRYRPITIHDFKSFNPNDFNEDLSCCNLTDSVNSSNNIDEAWKMWSTKVLGVTNKHAPLKRFRLKNRSNPWISQDIVKTMYKRDYLHKKFKATNDPNLLKEYKSTRNRLVKLIRQAKKRYGSTLVR